MISKLTDKLFISRRGDDFLVFSPDNLKVVVITQLEYLLLSCFIESSDYDTTVQQLSRRFSNQLKMSTEDCFHHLKDFLKQMISTGILPVSKEERVNKSLIQYPNKAFSPIAIYLHVTNKCNLNCLYCYNSIYRKQCNKNKTELDDNEIVNAIDQSIELGVTSFTISGGEPLLHPSCLSFGRYIKNEKGCYVELLTNGTLVADFSPYKLFDSFSLIVISLDSNIVEKHEVMRGKGTFGKILRGIDKLCKVDPKKVALRPVLHNLNIGDLENYIRWAHEEFGITRIQSSLYTPNDLSEIDDLNLLVSPDEYVNMMACYENIAKEGKIRLEIEDLSVNKGCGAGSSILSIGAQGEVFPCQALHSSDFMAGNIREKSLKEIGEGSPILKAIRNLGPNEIEGCEGCSLLRICGAGCRATAHALYGSIHKRNELLCPSYVKQCEFLLWKEADKMNQKLKDVSPYLERQA